MEQSIPVSAGGLSSVANEQARLQRRRLMNALITGLIVLLTAISVGVLLFIFVSIIYSGLFVTSDSGQVVFNSDFWNNILQDSIDGGLLSAIYGTLEMLAVAALIAVPLGLATAIYLSEYGGGQFASAVRFSLDLLAQMPSIVIGLFVWMFIVNYQILRQSGLAGALALSVIILPIVARTVEEILRLVPDHLREAGLALGTPRWRVIIGVVIPTVLPGIMTGVILSLARAAGETAPLLLVTGSNITNFDLTQPMGAIPLQIYQDAIGGNFPRAWGAALILVVVIAIFSALVRIITGRVRYES